MAGEWCSQRVGARYNLATNRVCGPGYAADVLFSYSLDVPDYTVAATRLCSLGVKRNSQSYSVNVTQAEGSPAT